jgi:N-acetylneuraminic acid mutarotase
MCYTNSFKVYLTGGLQVANNSPLNTTYEFGASNYLLGIRKKNMNHPRYGHGTVSIKGEIYVFGGFAHKDIQGEAPRTLASSEKLSSTNNSWEVITNMNKGRAFFGTCSIEN